MIIILNELKHKFKITDDTNLLDLGLMLTKLAPSQSTRNKPLNDIYFPNLDKIRTPTTEKHAQAKVATQIMNANS